MPEKTFLRINLWGGCGSVPLQLLNEMPWEKIILTVAVVAPVCARYVRRLPATSPGLTLFQLYPIVATVQAILSRNVAFTETHFGCKEAKPDPTQHQCIEKLSMYSDAYCLSRNCDGRYMNEDSQKDVASLISFRRLLHH